MATRAPIIKPIEELAPQEPDWAAKKLFSGYDMPIAPTMPPTAPTLPPGLPPTAPAIPRVPGEQPYYDPTGRFKTEAEYLAWERGEVPQFPSMGLGPMGLALGVRGLGAQFGREMAETLVGPELDILGQLPGAVKRALPAVAAGIPPLLPALGAISAARRIPEMIREERTPEEMATAWEARYQPFPMAKQAIEATLDPMAWIEGAILGQVILKPGVQLGVKLATPVVRRLYKAGLNKLGREIMEMGTREFGDDFVQAVNRADVKTPGDAARVLNEMRRSVVAKEPAERAAETAGERTLRFLKSEAGKVKFEKPLPPETLKYTTEETALIVKFEEATSKAIQTGQEAGIRNAVKAWLEQQFSKKWPTAEFKPETNLETTAGISKTVQGVFKWRSKQTFPAKADIDFQVQRLLQSGAFDRGEAAALAAPVTKAGVRKPTIGRIVGRTQEQLRIEEGLETNIGAMRQELTQKVLEAGKATNLQEAQAVVAKLSDREVVSTLRLPEAPVAPAIAKEPWMMTRAEYAEGTVSRMARTQPVPVGSELFARNTRWNDALSYHKGQVTNALSEGKPVPPEVLADYPDLAAAPVQAAKAVPVPRPNVIWADEFESVGGKFNPDGTVTLYHATTKEKAAQILKDGKLTKPPDAPDAYGVYFSSSPTVAQDYGDGTLVKVTVKATDLKLDDIFLGRRADFTTPTKAGVYKPIKVEAVPGAARMLPEAPTKAVEPRVPTPPTELPPTPPVKPPEVPPMGVVPQPLVVESITEAWPGANPEIIRAVAEALDQRIPAVASQIPPSGRPPTAIPGSAGSQPPEEAGMRFTASLRPFDDVISEVVSIDNPVLRTLIGRSGINPSVLQNNPVGKAIVAYYRQRVASEEISKVALSAAYDVHAKPVTGSMADVLPINNKGIWRGIGARWEDVMSWPGRYAKQLTPKQKAFIGDIRQLIDEVELLRVEAGLKPRAKTGPEGWFYVPRQVKGVRGIEFRKPSDPGLQRLWEDATEGAAHGVNYSNDPRANLELHLKDAFRDITTEQLSAHLEAFSVRPSELVSPAIRNRLETSIKEGLSTTKALRDTMRARRNWLKANMDVLPKELKWRWPTLKTNELEGVVTARKLANLRKLDNAISQAKIQRDAVKLTHLQAKNAYSRAMEAARKAEKAPAYLFGRTEDEIAVGQWRNRFFPREQADALREGLGIYGQSPQGGWLSLNFERLANTIRFLATVGDEAAPLIQGLPVLTENPTVWTRGSLRHYQSLFDPTVQSRLIRDHLATYQKMAQYGTPIGDPEFFAAMEAGRGFSLGGLLKGLPKGDEIRQLLRAGGKQTFGRFQASYATGLGYYRALLTEAHEATWKGTEAELQAFIRNLTGGLDSRALGVGPTQRAAEGMWGSMSPRLLRSTVSLLSDALRGAGTLVKGQTPSAQQAASLKALGKFLVGIHGLFILTGLALGKDWDEIKTGLNPLNGKKYLGYEINGDWIGVGGQIRAIIQLMAGIVAATAQGPEGLKTFISKNMWENPFIKFYRGRAAPGMNLASAIGEAMLGADLVPFEELDGAIDLIKHIGTSSLPFTVQGQLEGEKGATGTASFLGFRTSHPSAYQQLSAEQDRITKAAGIKNDKGKLIEAWDDLGPKQQAELQKANPQLAELEATRKAQAGTADLNAMAERDRQLAEAMAKRLPKNMQAELTAADVTIGVKRTIQPYGTDFYLNDARYQRYQDLVVEYLTKSASAMAKSTAWKSKSTKAKEYALQQEANDAREAARTTLMKEINAEVGKGTPTKAVATPTMTAWQGILKGSALEGLIP